MIKHDVSALKRHYNIDTHEDAEILIGLMQLEEEGDCYKKEMK